MQARDVLLIVGNNLLWRWRLRGWFRQRSCCVLNLWRRVLDDVLSFACEQLDQRITAGRDFLHVRPARRQIANVFEDGLAACLDKQLRFLETFSDANTYS